MNKSFIPLKWHAVLVALSVALAAEARPPHVPHHFVWPAQSHPYGKPMEEWAVAWCQWAYAFTEFNNPRTDSADCGLGQSGKVWFLADVLGAGGGGGVRECVMPQDKALFFPVHFVFGFSTPDYPLTEAELRAQNKVYFAYNDTNWVCEVDGRAVPHLRDRHRLETPAFSVTLADDSDFDTLPGGVYGPAVADGYWVMLAPLRLGEHTIAIRGGPPGSDDEVNLLVRLLVVPEDEYVPIVVGD